MKEPRRGWRRGCFRLHHQRQRQRSWQNRVLLLHKVAAGTLKRSVNRAPSVSPMGDVTGVVMGDGQTRWLTYRELAIALRINAASARRLVARNKQWPRRPGNDGLVRIGVPIEKLPRDDTHDVVDDPTRDVTHAPPMTTPGMTTRGSSAP